jgi:broad specificity phosphatase PhoE
MAVLVSPVGPRIILVRHGQCESNISYDFATYRDDADGLTELGVRQADSVAAALATMAGVRECRLVSSPLKRAIDTAGLISKRLGELVMHTDERLVEQSDHEVEGDFMRRIRSALADLEVNGRDVIAVTHGHVIQGAVALALDIDYAKVGSLYPVNGGISILQGRTLTCFNISEHLSDVD